MNHLTWRSSIGFAVGLTAILSLAEVPIPVAIRAVVVIMTQIVTGAYIYAHIPRAKPPTMTEYLGMGFAIGTALSTLCDIFLKSTPIKFVAWLVPTFVIILVVAGRNANKNRVVVAKIQDTTFESTDFFAVLVISFLYLAHDFVWYISLFASGLCILIAVNLRNRWRTRNIYLRSVIALTVLATASLLAGIQFRSPLWWINSDDYQLFESMQFSLARYGPRDHPGATGISLTAYHFLPYAWTGLVDRLSAAPTWVILNQVTPIVVSIALSALVWSFLTREGVHRPRMRFLLACLYPILFVLGFGSPSSAIGYIYLLAALFYWTDRNTAIIHWSRIPLGILFTVFVIGTKISNSPIIFVGLGILALGGIATRQPWKWVSLTDILVAIATGSLYYFLFLRYTTATTSIWVEPFGIAKQIIDDLNELNALSLLVIGGIATSAILVIPFLGAIMFSLHAPSRTSMLGYFSLPIFPLMAPFALFVGGHGATAEYFVNAALSVLLLITLLAISRSLRTGQLSNQNIFQFTIFVIAGFVSGFASIYLLHNIRTSGSIAPFSRAFASAHWISLVVMSALWLIYWAYRHKKLPRFAIVLTLILAGEIAASTTVTAYEVFKSIRKSNMSTSAAESIVGTPDEIAAARWLRSYVPVDAVIASNHFCGRAECFGSGWFNEQVDSFRITPKFSTELFGGANFVLPAYSERRFLIQGPRFLWGLSNPPEWAIARMNATLGFANGPNEITLQALRTFDVQYFVVDLASTTQRTWIPFGKLLYQNRSFAILELQVEQ